LWLGGRSVVVVMVAVVIIWNIIRASKILERIYKISAREILDYY